MYPLITSPGPYRTEIPTLSHGSLYLNHYIHSSIIYYLKLGRYSHYLNAPFCYDYYYFDRKSIPPIPYQVILFSDNN